MWGLSCDAQADQKAGAQANHGPDVHHNAHPQQAVDVRERDRQRRVLVELVGLDHAAKHQADRAVQHGADAERQQDAAGQVPLRVCALLRSVAHRVEADVREKNGRRSGENNRHSVRGERGQVGRVDVRAAGHDDDCNGDTFRVSETDSAVRPGLFGLARRTARFFYRGR